MRRKTGQRSIRELVTLQIVTIIMGKRSGSAGGLKAIETAIYNPLVSGSHGGALGAIRT